MSGPQNHILVDANIAKSAADPARHPTSSACLRLARHLQAKDCPTGAAMTPALMAEWRKHASRTMVAWLASMESRSRLRHFEDKVVRDLRAAVDAVADAGIRAAMLKDIHLSEAAIQNGVPVASQDDKQRKFLASLAGQYPLAAKVQWMNPVEEMEEWEAWVLAGCADRNVYRCETKTA